MYQDDLGQAACKTCPGGFACERNTTRPAPCPLGSYCESGTRYGTERLCPNGTYGAKMNLTQVSECSPCSPGHFCALPGLQAPTGPCKGGYFCGCGSSASNPHDSGASAFRASYAGETCVQVRNDTVNDVFPEGHYCPSQ